MDPVFTAESMGNALLSSDSDAIVASDGQGIIRFWNPGAERIFGYTAAAALGQSLDIMIPERLRARHWEGYRRVMAGAQSRYGAGDLLSVPALHADGTQLSVEFTIAPVRSAQGDVVGLIAVMRDVTARFEETRALKQKLRAMAETTPGQ